MAVKKAASKSKKSSSKTSNKRGRSVTKKNVKKSVSKKNVKKSVSKGRSVNKGKSVSMKRLLSKNKKNLFRSILNRKNATKNVGNYPAVFEKNGSFFRVSVCAKRTVDGMVLPPKCITKTFYKKLTNKDSSVLPTLPTHMRPQLPVFPLMRM